MSNMEKKSGKKGLWALIKESMTKTGGCCGSGGECCEGPEKGVVSQKPVHPLKKAR